MVKPCCRLWAIVACCVLCISHPGNQKKRNIGLVNCLTVMIKLSWTSASGILVRPRFNFRPPKLRLTIRKSQIYQQTKKPHSRMISQPRTDHVKADTHAGVYLFLAVRRWDAPASPDGPRLWTTDVSELLLSSDSLDDEHDDDDDEEPELELSEWRIVGLLRSTLSAMAAISGWLACNRSTLSAMAANSVWLACNISMLSAMAAISGWLACNRSTLSAMAAISGWLACNRSTLSAMAAISGWLACNRSTLSAMAAISGWLACNRSMLSAMAAISGGLACNRSTLSAMVAMFGWRAVSNGCYLWKTSLQ